MPKNHWVPLESNPDVINKYLLKLGLLPTVQFCDVYGTDEGLLSMVPDPCHAFILLFPISENYLNFTKTEKIGKAPETLFFMKQTIGNACGTIGILHALSSIKSQLKFSDNSVLEKLLDKFDQDVDSSVDGIAEKRANMLKFKKKMNFFGKK